ncbi:MAG: polysaccharide deacetylase family protein, partial [Verrucomicrobiales bacterium]
MNFVTYFAALSLGVVACAAETHKPSNEGNRLTVVDDAANLYYPDHLYPRLTTPQWAGEDVDFALVLAIDDMRDSGNYETYLRPILERLKKIDGRAPASVMANWCDPSDPQIKKWLEEGVTVETHTADHPCPILAKGDFAAAKSTYDRCVDHMFTIPNHKPVGFRTPCMDSINSASPRLFAEILMKTTDKGNFLANSSSVGVLLNSKDPELPKDLALDEKGNARFSKYVLKGFVNYIENYPYPYLVGNKMWELPFCMPDDYEGFAVLGEKSLQTVADMKAAIDAVAVKKGLWVMTFHPYAWLANTQVVELVDHVDGKYGKKGKFFNLREVQERMDKHLLGGHPVRAKNGDDNGVRLLDLNDDGYLDVVIGNDQAQQTRVWDQAAKKWLTTPFPGKIVTTRNGKTELAGARFGVMGGTGYAVLLQANEDSRSAWRFNGEKWTEAPELMNGLEAGGQKLLAAK